MTVFQILALMLAAIYIAINTYFLVTGRKIAFQDKMEFITYRERELDIRAQVDMFTTRIGQMQTENFNLQQTLRQYQNEYDEMKRKYEHLEHQNEMLRYENSQVFQENERLKNSDVEGDPDSPVPEENKNP